MTIIADQTPAPEEIMLRPGQVAVMFGVSPETLIRWANAGRVTATRTLGGHRRYRESEIRALLKAGQPS